MSQSQGKDGSWRCAYCGYENAVGSLRCSGCGSGYASPTPEGSSRPRPSKVSLLVLAWVIAILAMLPIWMILAVFVFLGDISSLAAALWDLPSGLWGFSKHEANGIDIAASWVLYVAVMAVFLRTRRRQLSLLFYAVLCAMLALNVPGCYKVSALRESRMTLP